MRKKLTLGKMYQINNWRKKMLDIKFLRENPDVVKTEHQKQIPGS